MQAINEFNWDTTRVHIHLARVAERSKAPYSMRSSIDGVGSNPTSGKNFSFKYIE